MAIKARISAVWCGFFLIPVAIAALIEEDFLSIFLFAMCSHKRACWPCQMGPKDVTSFQLIPCWLACPILINP
jgi:hypothetical protein